MSYIRRAGDDYLVVVCNFTPVPRENYRIGVPDRGEFSRLLSSDHARFGGSGLEPAARIGAEDRPFHGFKQSISLLLPPLATVVLGPPRR